MNIFKVITYQLYLLQLENYEIGRYWKLLFKKGMVPYGQELRKSLVWTLKAKVLLLIALALHAYIIWNAVWSAWYMGVSEVGAFVIALLIMIPGYFLFYTIGEIVLYPADAWVKKRLVQKARLKILDSPKLKIIGIAGSYGKTTMKEVLLEVLGSKFNVAATPESVNTPVGIARWISEKCDNSLEVAIVEMGEHYRGDIKYLCGMVRPDIAVVTGINEAHLERLKDIGTAVKTIFEITENAKPEAVVVLNGDDRRVSENYKNFIQPGQKLVFYRDGNLQNSKFDTDRLLWGAEVEGLGMVEISLLGEYGLGAVFAAVQVGKILGLTEVQIKTGLSRVKPIEHRLQPIRSTGDMLVIDDSYNGNPTGVLEAVKVLSRFVNRRKIYITPGLVESGSKVKEVHEEIGRQLSGVADVVVLIKNSVTPFIESGIKEGGTGRNVKIVWFDTAQEAHENLKIVVQPGDVVLFQNDWGDQYV